MVLSNAAVPELCEGVGAKLLEMPINVICLTFRPVGLGQRISNLMLVRKSQLIVAWLSGNQRCWRTAPDEDEHYEFIIMIPMNINELARELAVKTSF